MRAIKASGAPILFETVDNIKDKLTPEATASIKKTGVCLKGEFVTGVGKGTLVSVNIELRKQFQMCVGAPGHSRRPRLRQPYEIS